MKSTLRESKSAPEESPFMDVQPSVGYESRLKVDIQDGRTSIDIHIPEEAKDVQICSVGNGEDSTGRYIVNLRPTGPNDVATFPLRDGWGGICNLRVNVHTFRFGYPTHAELDGLLKHQTYIGSVSSPTEKDWKTWYHIGIPPSPQYHHLTRWYNHLQRIRPSCGNLP